MRILITGANGFIGRRLISRLSNRHDVLALVRRPDHLASEERITPVVIDLGSPFDYEPLPSEIDAIIHLAQANVPFPDSAGELFAVNAGSTQRLLDYGRRAGARRFILASTGDVYGRRTGLFKETDAAGPASYYSVTKYASELLVQAYSDYLEPCILRLFHPYGPGQSGRLIPKLAAGINQRRPVRLNQNGGPVLTPIYIDDVVRAIEIAMASSYCGMLNIAGSKAVKLSDLAEEIGRVLDVQPDFQYSTEEAWDMAGDNNLMKQILGDWPMTSLVDGLSQTFKG